MSDSSFLVFKDICKTFNKDSLDEVVVFDKFNLTLAENEFLSIVGSNGSGKTTLLNLLCGNILPDSGSILLRGKDITGMKEYQRANFIGRVFQDPSKGTCASLTILENMSLADHKGKHYGFSFGVNRKRIDYYKSNLELLHLGLENKINQKVGTLSGGQRQALALLLSTMTPIDLLVLDEHTAALDPKSSENVMRLTESLVKEKNLTTLMVTHNLRFSINYGSRLMMMHEGKAVIDLAGADKQNADVEDLLKVFNQISIECGN